MNERHPSSACGNPEISGLSVIVNTYNNPHGLALVLAGVLRQSLQPDEILVADDGSEEETQELVHSVAKNSPLPVRHVWHEDTGFRKCHILNKSIVQASGEYLVFFDGDCVPRKTCLATHARVARRNRYVTGGAVFLMAGFSQSLSPSVIDQGVFDRPGGWWFNTKKARRVIAAHLPGIRCLLDHNVKRLPGWRGGNASTFKEHLTHVGGYDERFSYGYEDADLGHRLEASGVLGYSVRYREPVIHVEHDRPYSNPETRRRNKEIYDQNRVSGMQRTPYGI